MRDLANNPELAVLAATQDGSREAFGSQTAKFAKHVIKLSQGPFTSHELFFRSLYGFDPDITDDVDCTEATYELSELLMKLRKPELAEEPALVQTVSEGNAVGELGLFPGSTSLFRLKLKDLTPAQQPDDMVSSASVIVGSVEVALRKIEDPYAAAPAMNERVSAVKIAEVKTRYEGRVGLFRESEDVGHIAIGWDEIAKAPHSDFASSDVAGLVVALHNYQLSDAIGAVLGDGKPL